MLKTRVHVLLQRGQLPALFLVLKIFTLCRSRGLDGVKGVIFFSCALILDIIHTGSSLFGPHIEIKHKVAITKIIELIASSDIQADRDQERERPGHSAVIDREIVQLWHADDLIKVIEDKERKDGEGVARRTIVDDLGQREVNSVGKPVAHEQSQRDIRDEDFD